MSRARARPAPEPPKPFEWAGWVSTAKSGSRWCWAAWWSAPPAESPWVTPDVCGWAEGADAQLIAGSTAERAVRDAKGAGAAVRVVDERFAQAAVREARGQAPNCGAAPRVKKPRSPFRSARAERRAQARAEAEAQAWAARQRQRQHDSRSLLDRACAILANLCRGIPITTEERRIVDKVFGEGFAALYERAYRMVGYGPAEDPGVAALRELGLDPGSATVEAVQSAFRRRAKAEHPDRVGGNADMAALVAVRDRAREHLERRSRGGSA